MSPTYCFFPNFYTSLCFPHGFQYALFPKMELLLIVFALERNIPKNGLVILLLPSVEDPTTFPPILE